MIDAGRRGSRMVAGERNRQITGAECFELKGTDLAMVQILAPSTRGRQTEPAPDRRQ